MAQTTCEMCGGMGLALTRYRLVRMQPPEESRVVWLCTTCRSPLDKMMTVIAPKKTATPITVTPVDELSPTEALRGLGYYEEEPAAKKDGRSRRGQPMRRV